MSQPYGIGRLIHTREVYSDESSFCESLELDEKIDYLRQRFELPPHFMTRSAIKSVHTRLDDFAKQLVFLYSQSIFQRHWGNLQALLTIYTDVCPDSVLCERFFGRGEMLSKVVDLYDTPVESIYILHLLSLLSKRGSDGIRTQMIQHFPVILHALKPHINAPLHPEYASTVFAHCLDTLYSQPSSEQSLISLPLHDVLGAMLDALRSPRHSLNAHLVGHALAIFTHIRSTPLPSLSQRGRSNLSLRKLLHSIRILFAALSKSQNPGLRALSPWYFMSHEPNTTPPLARACPPRSVLSLSPSTFSRAAREHMEQFGGDKCELALIQRSTQAFRTALADLARDKDFCNFGLTAARAILQAPIVYDVCDAAALQRNGLPYAHYTECFPAAADALRFLGTPSDLDMADVLELEHLTLTDAGTYEIVRTARCVLQRNPQHGYACMVFCQNAPNREEALQSLARALHAESPATGASACISPYVRCNLLFHAAELSLLKGWTLWLTADPDDVSLRTKGFECLLRAISAAETYLSEAPPDAREHLRLIDAFILSGLLGHRAGPEMGALQPKIEAYERIQERLSALGYAPAARPLRAAREKLHEYVTVGTDTWGELVAHMDTIRVATRSNARTPRSKRALEQELAAWCRLSSTPHERSRARTGSGMSIERGPLRCLCFDLEEAYEGSVVLHRCATCAKASAVLRKCAGCGKVVYCNKSCQKAHWETHRETCQSQDATA